jgi:TetR/AcrR family transcriptional regulator, cholesterol catabolism regulator
MIDIQIKLFKRVEELFFRLGIRNLTMDDVARELGMSKKTLYLHVENKEDLVRKVFLMGIEAEKMEQQNIHEKSTDAIHEMLGIAHYVMAQVQQVKPSLLFDLQRYYPESWELMHDFQTKTVKIWIKANVERGINEGFYRADLNAEIVASLYVSASGNMCNERFFPLGQIAFRDLIRHFMLYHLRGVLSENGHRVLEKRLELNPL